MRDSLPFRSARGSGQAVAWQLRRNCSVAPRQLALLYAGLCGVSLAIGAGFWWIGAPLVLAFAGLELLALGVALLVYARHAVDGETVSVADGRLTVARETAGTLERMEFGCAQVRIASPATAHGLIEVSAQGQRWQVGRHVRPEWRPQLAGEMRRAVQAASTGGPRRAWDANHG